MNLKLKAHRPSSMSSFIPFVVSICLVVIVSIVLKAVGRKPYYIEGGHFYSEGYVMRLRRMVEARALVFDPDTRQVVLVEDRFIPEDYSWVSESRVKRDIDETNLRLKEVDTDRPPANPGLPIWLSNGKPSIDMRGTGIVLPSAHIGSVRATKLAGGDGIALLGGQFRLQLIASDQIGPTVPLFGSGPPEVPAPASEFFLAAKPGASDYFGSISLGNGGARITKRGKSAVRIYVNGSECEAESILKIGDLVGFELDGRERGVERVSASLVATGSRATSQRGVTVDGLSELSSTIAGLGAYYEILDRQRNSCKSDGVRSAKIEATLDPRLQTALHGLIETSAKRLNRSLEDPENSVEPISALLMDALTGEIVAMSSWPSPSSAEPSGLTARARARFRREQSVNYNFRRHVVGSAAKPFWVAATLDCYPILGGLEVGLKPDDRGYVTSTLGLDFGRRAYPQGFPKERAGKLLDKRWFFAHSTNSYFIDLMLLGLATRPPGVEIRDVELVPGSTFQDSNSGKVAIGGQPIRGTPLISPRYLLGSRVANFESHDISKRLSAAFDIDIGVKPDKLGDLKIIDPLVKLADERERDVFFRNTDLTPDYPHLDLAGIKTLSPDLTSHLLGGGEAQWTNVKLSEAIARLGTGRRVTATLIRTGPRAEAPEFADLTPHTRNVLRQGLQGATNTADDISFGATTASLLTPLIRSWNSSKRGRLPTGYTIRCYSKTGTAYFSDSDRRQNLDSGNFIFCLTVEDPQGKPVRAYSGAIFVRRRGSSVKTAVPIAERIFQMLKDLTYLDYSKQ